jgi:mersacidin/lichenicidin family type 2 lantibiotic
MSPMEITRAWKDCAFREGLTEAQRALLPPHPAGASATNGYQGQEHPAMLGPTHEILTMGCCDGLTQGIGVCSWFCGSGAGDVTYGCCTPGRTF